MKKKLRPIIYTIIFISIIFTIFIIDHYHQEKINTMTYNKYLMASQNIKKTIEQAIDQKKQQGLTLAFSLANNQQYIQFFQDGSGDVDLSFLSNTLKKYTNQKNVWIHFVSKEGISIYRSWTKKRGDNVAKIRDELPPLLLNPKPVSLISVGIFDLAFKNIVPVYSGDTFLGIVEVVTKVNSITNNLALIGYDPIVLVDKKYKTQLKKPFTKRFVDSYYIANLNAQEKFLKQIGTNIQKYITNEKFLLDNGKLVVTYQLKDVFDRDMAYFIIFEDMEEINTQDIDNFDAFIKTLGFFGLLLVIAVLISFYYYNRSRYTKKLETMVQTRTKEILELKDYHEALFDKNPNIVFVAAVNYGIIEANDSFFEFFSTYQDLEEFNENNNYLYEYTLKIDDDDTYIDPFKEWRGQVIKENRKICLKKDDVIYHFRVEAEILEHKEYDEVYLITFTDITELLSAQKDLETKQELLYQQSKLASMGEMIGNIAHQWRQPLSIISSGATGMLMQKQMATLEDEQFEKTCITINDNAQYLSRTIDDFKNFIKNDREFVEFNLKENIDSFLNLVVSSFKRHNIEIVLQVDESIELKGYPNELIQCFMNIFNNAKDALKDSPHAKKCLVIEAYKENKNVVIKFRDNAGGIEEKNLSRVFEPYFTTKHQTHGTGLGLSMTYNLITQGMNGIIEADNVNFNYEGEFFNGAEFTIKLPLS